MPILVTPPNKKAIRVNRTRFSLEVDLQKYVYENPEAIPVDEIKEDVHLLILERESPTTVGAIDILATDNEGDIYIIETKLYRNPDKRLVLAQVMDYGAALWRNVADPDEWIQQFDRRQAKYQKNSLLEMLEQHFDDSQRVLDGIKSSLSSGNFHFLVLMDEVPSALKDLILYMNENSRFRVYAVEMEYYVHDGYQILIPHLFGAESPKKSTLAAVGGGRQWDETSFFEDAKEKLKDDDVKAIRKVYEAAKQFADLIAWGRGKGLGSLNPKVHAICKTKSLFSITSNGELALNYYWLNDDDFTIQCGALLKKRLTVIPPLRTAIEKSNKKYPTIPISAWKPYTEQFIKVLQEYVDECRKLGPNHD